MVDDRYTQNCFRNQRLEIKVFDSDGELGDHFQYYIREPEYCKDCSRHFERKGDEDHLCRVPMELVRRVKYGRK